jgi:F0F1-type ATP synthase beta subunit
MATKGVIRSIKGLVVQVEFDEDYPDINELLLADDEHKSPLLVDNVNGAGMVVCLNARAVNSLQKNMTVTRTGKGLEIPVGEALIGRVVDAMGAPIDGHPPVEETKGAKLEYRNIFHEPGTQYRHLRFASRKSWKRASRCSISSRRSSRDARSVSSVVPVSVRPS